MEKEHYSVPNTFECLKVKPLSEYILSVCLNLLPVFLTMINQSNSPLQIKLIIDSIYLLIMSQDVAHLYENLSKYFPLYNDNN